jgi:hypothetical protein
MCLQSDKSINNGVVIWIKLSLSTFLYPNFNIIVNSPEPCMQNSTPTNSLITILRLVTWPNFLLCFPLSVVARKHSPCVFTCPLSCALEVRGSMAEWSGVAVSVALCEGWMLRDFNLRSFIIHIHSAIRLRKARIGRKDTSRWPRDTQHSQKMALTSPTRGGRSVGIVHSRIWFLL